MPRTSYNFFTALQSFKKFSVLLYPFNNQENRGISCNNCNALLTLPSRLLGEQNTITEMRKKVVKILHL